jgi:hypothetical protein
VKEETLGLVFDGDAEKVVEGPQVLHRELPLEGDDHAPEEISGGCREHNIVNVEQQVRCHCRTDR